MSDLPGYQELARQAADPVLNHNTAMDRKCIGIHWCLMHEFVDATEDIHDHSTIHTIVTIVSQQVREELGGLHSNS